MRIRFDGVLHWYVDAYDPAEDRCSKCRALIPEEDVPLVLFHGRGRRTQMARLHWEPCATNLMASGYLTLQTRRMT